MLSRWVLNNTSLKKLEAVFPISVHSFMPQDRVFGNTEKVLKKQEVIIRPKDYVDIIATNATITKMGDIQMLDFRSAAKDVLKSTARWPFKISECKRFIMKRSKTVGNVFIRGELHFNSDIGKAVNLCKIGMITNMVLPSTVPLGAPMNLAKRTDVDALLKSIWALNGKPMQYVSFM
ncbi:unnamed protein product [Parnassius apollo]|uniref:(apollo) hypothetical protein n=1 Tax=Parnassius apollo TaxID=110799 RepID=A0A8S3Y402_PARAO|nr:unnamed protein product [Parnassius apollo]